MELQNYKVSTVDPFLNAEKWNGALEYSQNFEGILSAILGKKFKGIYKPHKTYAINDYVWHDGKCYMITGLNSQTLNVLQKDYVKDPFYLDGRYLCLLNGRLSTVSDGNTKTLNDKVVSSISYYDSKEFAIGLHENKIFKLNFDKTNEQINITHTNNIIKIVQDDLYIYCLTDENKIIKSETSNCSSTFFVSLNLNLTHDVIDVAVNDKYLFVLSSNNDINIYNKETGGRLGIKPINEFIKKIDKARITSSDDFSLAIHDGENAVVTLFMENMNLTFSDKLVFKQLSIAPTQFSYSNNNFTMMNGNVISNFISSRYSLKETNLKLLINATSSIELNNAYLGLDFTKGQLVSVSGTTKQPINFSDSKTATSNGIYNDGTNIVEIINGKGAKFNSSRKLKYANEDSMINKLIFIEFDRYVTNGSTKSLGYISYSNRNGVKIVPSPITINEPFKCIIRLTGTTGVIKSETFTFKDSVLVSQTSQNQFTTTEASRLNIQPESGVDGLIKRIAIIDSYDMDIIDVLSSCSFTVPSQCTTSPLPNSDVKTNSNGAIYTRAADNSIVNLTTGIKVNSSSNPRTNNAEVMLNTVGSKSLDDRITAVQNSLPGYSPINHKHQFAELLNVPSASTGVKGIVQLTSSVGSTSEVLGATAKAVKSAYDKASHTHPYAPAKHSHIASDLPNGTTGAKGVVQLSNSPNSESQSLAATPFALRRLAESLTHGHDYVPKGGYGGSGRDLLNAINTKVAYIPGHSFHGLHRGDGNNVYWKGDGVGWVRFWDALNFNPDTKIGTNGGTIWGNLTVHGTVRANTITQASDINLKKDINKIENPLESIEKISGYSYKYKKTDESDLGVLAQEIEEIFPELVVEDETGYKSVKYNGLIGLLIESVKELKKRVDEYDSK